MQLLELPNYNITTPRKVSMFSTIKLKNKFLEKIESDNLDQRIKEYPNIEKKSVYFYDLPDFKLRIVRKTKGMRKNRFRTLEKEQIDS